MFLQNVVSIVKTLHWRHGVGDVTAVRVFADGRIELDAKGFGMRPATYRGTIVQKGPHYPFGKVTVRLHRHQVTATIVGEA